MKRLLMSIVVLLCMLLCCVGTMAQSVVLPDSKLGQLTDRLMRVAKVLPQEKVYVHMDNTSYFLGDSIWFAAYLRRTSDDSLSHISGILYVELLNQDGYLMERQLIDVRGGMGSGVFHLNPDWYAGYYELRAYTRWQLNWGVYERKHSSAAKYWFINKDMERRYFRDYEKLYSRVFPVYNEPKAPGQYNELMTQRELARTYSDKYDKPKLQLQLFPEGGALIEGVPCRVAFEAGYSDGRACEGEVTIGGEKMAATQNRGRGIFEIVPTKGQREVEFTTPSGAKVSARLPKAEADGVALRVEQRDSTWHIGVRKAGTVQHDTLGMTVMHEGRVSFFRELTDTVAEFNLGNIELNCGNAESKLGNTGSNLGNAELSIDNTGSSLSNAVLECGVNQVTVFDSEGRVYADRLFFVTKPELFKPSLTIEGMKDCYEPYEQIRLTIKAPLPAPPRGREDTTRVTASPLGGTGEGASASISLSIRDSETSNRLFDNASIMAEMLLSSEIRGFVPAPDWYFESDDQQRRTALDLLMMTQGWRRFDWRGMAVRGAWELTQPSERTPVIVGNLYKYYPGYFYHPKDMLYSDDWAEYYNMDSSNEEAQDGHNNNEAQADNNSSKEEEYNETLADRLETERNVKRRIPGSVLIHTELIPLGEKKGAVGEMTTNNGKFVFALPRFYNPAVFFISASDTAKWERRKSIFSRRKRYKRYEWIQKMPDEWDYRKFRSKDGEYSIRVDWPYPRFVKPYNYYQQEINYYDNKALGTRILDDGTRQMEEARVRARRPSYHIVHDSLPAFIVDGYEAYNYALDAGMLSSCAGDIARAYVGDYGLDNPYALYVPPFGQRAERDDRLRVLRSSDEIKRWAKDLTLNDDSISLRRNLSVEKTGIIHPGADSHITPYAWAKNYGTLSRIENYVLYTEYQPRLIGSERYVGSNLPYTYIVICPYTYDRVRLFYRDRRYVLPGISWPELFYSPDYSQRELPAEPTDYRRTLYWNPALPLDSTGSATVDLWNNSRTTRITVSAEGMTNSGEVLTGLY